MLNLFFRGQKISDIKKLRYAEMKEWNEYHEIMKKEEDRQANLVKNGAKK